MQIDSTRKGAKPAYVREAVEASLRRLKTDYIDLYQLHQADPETPITDTLDALDGLVRSGKIREIGCSNFSASQLEEAMKVLPASSAKFTSLQSEFNLLQCQVEIDVLPTCAHYGTAFIPYFPLASGLLTGIYHLGDAQPTTGRFGPGGWGVAMYTTENLKLVGELTKYAGNLGMSMLELAFNWLLSQPCVASAIAGAMTPEQATANAKAFSRKLEPDELSQISAILTRP